jgi:enoyl-CoA hydratase/carnithine racemase
MTDLVFLEKSNGVAYVIMNSPPANAMSPDLLKQFDELLAQLETDPESRAVVFRSALEKIFMAGADLKYLLSLDEDGFRAYIKFVQDLVNRIEALPQPTIAVLNGHALGGGMRIGSCLRFSLYVGCESDGGASRGDVGIVAGSWRDPTVTPLDRAKQGH